MIPIMRNILIVLWTILIGAGIFSTGEAAAGFFYNGEPNLRVGIWTGQSNISISADAEYELIDNEKGQSLGRYAPKTKLFVTTAGDGSIAVNAKTTKTRSITALPVGKGESFLEINKRRYRGSVEIFIAREKSGLTVVNSLPLEQYLYGVIAREISPDWPLEAVKAQAVAARTYALYHMGKHKSEGFDLCASTDCQVYGGRESEQPRSLKAVDETKGVVALYRGKLISALFHSSGGGYTESVSNVWGGNEPYLIGTVDFDQKSPYYQWERTVTPIELSDQLKNAGYKIGDLQAIELSVRKSPPGETYDRGPSGRVKFLRCIGTMGSVEIPGAKFRTLLGLPSTLFDIQMVVPRKEKIDLELIEPNGFPNRKTVEINMPPMAEKGLITDTENIRRITGRAGEVLIISGFGSGHGVGLSQWGAKALAEKAAPGDSNAYINILKHYYQGIDVQKIY